MQSPHSCVFCAETIQDSLFAESAHSRAIYNLSPILPGHCLIIPKLHYQSLLELKAEEFEDFMHFARRVTEGLYHIFQADGFNWTLQDGASAGQTVFHVHLHLIPRYLGDFPDPGDWYPVWAKHEEEILDSRLRPKLSTKEMRAIVQKLKKEF